MQLRFRTSTASDGACTVVVRGVRCGGPLMAPYWPLSRGGSDLLCPPKETLKGPYA